METNEIQEEVIELARNIQQVCVNKNISVVFIALLGIMDLVIEKTKDDKLKQPLFTALELFLKEKQTEKKLH